jgi:HD-GYP domain-containing protein (c-di-GMP phosphodiesterase class II)
MARSAEEIIRLSDSDVKVGVALPWNTFDNTGRLLLREGAIISSDNQLNALLQRGMYRQNTRNEDSPASTKHVVEDKLNPFTTIGELLKRTQVLLQNIIDGQSENAKRRVERLCIELDALQIYDADAALAAMHLDQEGPYCIRHSLYCALVSCLIARRKGYDKDTKMTIMAAALTANVAMLDLQEELLAHEGPLPNETWEVIKHHPDRGVSLLKAVGIDDLDWLTIVEQHHEKCDGSGYNKGLHGSAIHEGAKIVGVADRYHVLISDRARRRGLPPTDSLRKLFILKEHLDEECVLAFIKEIGIYPPGVYVRLSNGETGIVIRRGKDGVSPQVASIIGPRGAHYIKPFVRDCQASEYAIKERTEPLEIPESSLYGLWGYGNFSGL